MASGAESGTGSGDTGKARYGTGDRLTMPAGRNRRGWKALRRQRLSPSLGVATVVVAAVLALVALLANDSPGGTAVVVVAGFMFTTGVVMILVAVQALGEERELLVLAESEARRLAELDGLTGLGNYRMFRRSLEAEAARSERHGSQFSLVVLDLDGFKAVNDQAGHQAGDRALQDVAAALRGVLRTEDVLCRQGGDEFAVIAVEAAPADARYLATRLVEAVNHASIEVLPSRPLTGSAGWATFGPDAASADELLHRADEALLRAKRYREGAEVSARDSLRSAGAVRGADARIRTPDRRGAGIGSVSFTVVANLARALAGARTERSVAEIGVAHLAGAVDGTLAALVRVDPQSGQLVVSAIGGRAGTHAWGRLSPDERTVLAAAVQENRSAMAHDLNGDETIGFGIRSAIAAPVRENGDIWGALTVESEQPSAFDEGSRALVEAMASQIGRGLMFVGTLERLKEAPYGRVYRHAAALAGPDCLQVALLAWRVGRLLELERLDLQRSYLGGLFHDIGTIRVPHHVLLKPGRLTEDEFAVVREHPIVGQSILEPLPWVGEAAGTVRHEHERYDGGGYPDGLAGESIPPTSRIVLACNAYVAMTSPRPWRPALGPDDAEEELRFGSGEQFDPEVVGALLGVLEAEPGLRVP
jgi:diguanylate cyclase (GGDEF)-like protein